MTYPCMSRTTEKANVQDIQYCLFDLASDIHWFQGWFES